MSRHFAIANAFGGNSRKGRLQGSEKFAAQLILQLINGIGIRNIAADVGIEEDGVLYLNAVFSKTPDTDINIDAGTGVDNAERDRIRCTVFETWKFFGIEIVDALILRRAAAEC